MTRLLVVDDDGLVRAVFRELLSARDYEVIEAARLRPALEIAGRGDIDLVLLDLGLPNGDGGVNAVREMRKVFDGPLIVVTGSVGDVVADECFAAGADDFIGKPPSTVELLAKVRQNLLHRIGVPMDTRPRAEPDKTLTGMVTKDLTEMMVAGGVEREKAERRAKEKAAATKKWTRRAAFGGFVFMLSGGAGFYVAATKDVTVLLLVAMAIFMAPAGLWACYCLTKADPETMDRFLGFLLRIRKLKDGSA